MTVAITEMVAPIEFLCSSKITTGCNGSLYALLPAISMAAGTSTFFALIK